MTRWHKIGGPGPSAIGQFEVLIQFVELIDYLCQPSTEGREMIFGPRWNLVG